MRNTITNVTMVEKENYNEMTDNELIEWIRTREGYEREGAYEALINRHKGIIFDCMKKIFGSDNVSMDKEDAMSVGYEGMCKAVNTYNPEKETKFSTYVYKLIYNELSKFYYGNSEFHITPAMKKRIKAVVAIMLRIKKDTGRNASFEEIASETDLTVKQVKRALSYSSQENTMVRLDAASSHCDEDGIAKSIGDYVPGNAEYEPENCVLVSDKDEFIEEGLDCLNERERFVMVHSTGIYDEKIMTYEEIGKACNVSKGRISQIKDKAKDKLQECAQRLIADGIDLN